MIRYNIIHHANSNPYSYMIGGKKVNIQKAIIYCPYVWRMLSLLMGYYLFGIKFEKLKPFVITERTSTITCHLSTNQSIYQLFFIKGLFSVTLISATILVITVMAFFVTTLMVMERH